MPDELTNLTDADLDRVVPTFKAAGADRQLTLRELIQQAQLGFGAAAKMQEAAEARKRAEADLAESAKGREFLKAVEELRNGDEDAFFKVASTLGMKPGVAKAYWQSIYGEDEPSPTQTGESSLTTPATSGRITPVTGKLSLDQMPDEVLQVLGSHARLKREGYDPEQVTRLSAGLLNQDSEERAGTAIQRAIANSAQLRDVLKRTPPEKRQSLMAAVMGDVVRRVKDGNPLPDAIKNAVNERADLVEAAGVGSRDDDLSSLVFGFGGQSPSRSQMRLDSTTPPSLDPKQVGKEGKLEQFIAQALQHASVHGLPGESSGE